MTQNSNRSKAAFTLVEMLVVIAIMAILAALVAGGASLAGKKKNVNRVKTELANLESVIARYHSDQQFYPPSSLNADGTAKAELPPLFYELSGTRYDGTQYRSLNGDQPIPDAAIQTVFGITGFANSNPETVKNYFSSLKTNQYSRVGGVEVLIVPVEGPAEPEIMNDFGKRVNTWRYVSKGATNNPNSFDLWADIIVGSNTNRIGNWKE